MLYVIIGFVSININVTLKPNQGVEKWKFQTQSYRKYARRDQKCQYNEDKLFDIKAEDIQLFQNS